MFFQIGRQLLSVFFAIMLVLGTGFSVYAGDVNEADERRNDVKEYKPEKEKEHGMERAPEREYDTEKEYDTEREYDPESNYGPEEDDDYENPFN